MTKAQHIQELMKAIEASKADKKITKAALIETISSIAAEYVSTASKKEVHPNLLDDEGKVVQVWCLKHNQYEDVEGFAPVAKSPTGYHNKCKVADYQWKDYLAKIRQVDIKLSEALDAEDYASAGELNKEKKSLIASKDGLYDYPDADEIERLSPTKK